MILYPAIDLRKGQCVRLYQGDYARETVYSQDPLSIARKYGSEGASWLHLVDLDGAENPSQSQTPLILDFIQSSPLKIQIGGGIRTKVQVQTLLDQGVARVIIGSKAVNQPNEILNWFKIFGPEKIVLAFDVLVNEKQETRVAIQGWQKASSFLLDELIEMYLKVGLKHLLCTNIALDGTLKGPDFGLYEGLLQKYPTLELQASGGIQSLSDIQELREKGLAGAIIGRALYENRFSLEEALSC